MDKMNDSRRRFLKNSVITSAAVSTFHIVGTSKSKAAEPIRVGVVGCGGRGKAAAEDAVRASDQVKIVALADVFPYQLKIAQKRLLKSDQEVPDSRCFSGFDGYKKVLDSDIDYVILATPPVFRPTMLEAAIEAGKHVFMEKPAAVDAPGIRKIIAAGEKAKKKNLSIAAGTQRRHDPAYKETIAKIHDGLVGDINYMRATWCTGPIGYRKRRADMSEMEYQIRNWYHYLWLSGDHIVEQHVHNIDVCLWAIGKSPIRAYGMGGRAWQQWGNIWDHHAVDFEFDNGVHMFSIASQVPRPKDDRMDEYIHGTKGVSNCKEWIKGQNNWTYQGDHMNPYIQEHIDLIASIQNGEPINEAESCAKSTMTAIMGRMAEYKARFVTWEEAFNSDETLGFDNYALGPVDARPVPVPGPIPFSGDVGWKPDTDE